MSDPIDALTLPVEARVMYRVMEFIGNEIDPDYDHDGTLEDARLVIAEMIVKGREEDTKITPSGESPVVPRLLISAGDNGRTKRGMPIRNVSMEWTVRANSKTDAGVALEFQKLCGAVETLLDGLIFREGSAPDRTALMDALSSEDWKVQVLLAIRPGGVRHRVHGDIRECLYTLEVRALGSEYLS